MVAVAFGVDHHTAAAANTTTTNTTDATTTTVASSNSTSGGGSSPASSLNTTNPVASAGNFSGTIFAPNDNAVAAFSMPLKRAKPDAAGGRSAAAA